ncbi:MAG: replicative DNA helicase [Candidatus Doudnabacteria bacterium]|nr:replicative DNA helicase [Candidatus Doudnabacteria bacterium]
MADRVPPQNLDAERSVLGAILLDSTVLTNVADDLKAEHFYSPQNAIIYEGIVDLYQHAKPIDVVTLTSILKSKKKLQQVGGSAYLSELIAGVPTSAHAKEYALIVKQAFVRRSLMQFATKLEEQAVTEDKEITQIMDELEGRLFSLSQDSTQRDFQTAAALLEQHFEITEEYSKNPNALRGLSSGMRAVDEILGGLHNSDLIILAARPSVGKSSFAFDIARNVAIDQAKSVAIFSLEMPGVQVIQRVLSQQIDVSLWDLRMARMTDQAYARFAEGAGKLADAKLFIDDTPGLNIMQLRSKARKLKIEHGLDFMIIDYLQLMQSVNARSDNRASEVAEISRSLKLLARELNIPIMALSQLNRAVESRNDHIPQLSDLRESGSIEQDADLVIFLSREKLFNPETENPDKVDVFIAKHRNGPVGKVELKFVEKTTKFVDVDV